MAFTTIYVAPGLDGTARRRAYSVGPRAVASRADQRRLVELAGFVDIDHLDVTAAFVDTTRAWIEERARHADGLAALEAPGAFEQRQADHRDQLTATETGLLRRGIFSAMRP